MKYLGHTLTWEKGRQLKSFDSNTYTYNANGIRTSKTVNGVKHTYILDGNKILREMWGSNTLIPLYDNENNVCGITYNNVPYYFIKNLQGDIIAILDKDAQTVARYSYDAWGVCTVTQDTSNTDIANVNPFRYRGYYYDKEIGLYYLQSRYYDSGVGRFINGDTPDSIFAKTDTSAYNLYDYCDNTPTGSQDYSGFLASILINAAFAAVTTWLLYLVEYKLGMRYWSWWALAGLVLANAAMGAVMGALFGGPFTKLTKLVGLAPKCGLSGVALKAIKLVAKGAKLFINMIIKPMTRKPGESWFKAVKRLFT